MDRTRMQLLHPGKIATDANRAAHCAPADSRPVRTEARFPQRFSTEREVRPEPICWRNRPNMDVEQLPGEILPILICLLAAMGLWYLSIRRGSLKMKQFAVMIGAMPVLVIGLNLASTWFGWDNRDYRTTAVGPSRREP